MNITFVIDRKIDLIALYAAILSTITAICEIYKWYKRSHVEVTCTPNMIEIPSSNKNTYIVIRAINRGSTNTTITNCLGYCWNNHLSKLLRREKKAFIVPVQDIPKTIGVGEQWHGKILQTEEIERWASKKCLYIGIIHSMSGKEVIKRKK